MSNSLFGQWRILVTETEEAAVVQGLLSHYVPPLINDEPIQESLHSDEHVNKHTSQDDEQLAKKQPADSTQADESEMQTVLQGTITALKLTQQIVGLAPVPGLQRLVGVVLNISEAVNVSFLVLPWLTSSI
jgi:hypothetical protein